MNICHLLETPGKFHTSLKTIVLLISCMVLQLHGQNPVSNPDQDLRDKAARGDAKAQNVLGWNYSQGIGVGKADVEAVKWFRKAADQNYASAQYNLGYCYSKAKGVKKDHEEAMRWFYKAAVQNHANSQYAVGYGYCEGQGVKKDYKEAVKWLQKAAVQNVADAQWSLAASLELGLGTVKDETEAYKWYLLAGAQGHESARQSMSRLEKRLTREQIAEGQRLARNFMEMKAPELNAPDPVSEFDDTHPKSTGTGFFITEDGFFITNQHVIGVSTKVRLMTSAGLIPAAVVKVDMANDLALLKCEGKFSPLPVVSSRDVKLGNSVATVGFPNTELQGYAPKLAKGDVASLTGAADDARYFQVSVPVQPGNSGGALVDEHGNVVGVMSAKLSALETLRTYGTLPENVNYAVKSSFLLSFLESVPAVSNRLKEPNAKEEKFENVVDAAQRAAVLILVY